MICTYSQVEDKGTAIDVAILKDDRYKTGGHLRWVEGSNMVTNSLTKKMSRDFLIKMWLWALPLSKSGHQALPDQYDLLFLTIHKPTRCGGVTS